MSARNLTAIDCEVSRAVYDPATKTVRVAYFSVRADAHKIVEQLNQKALGNKSAVAKECSGAVVCEFMGFADADAGVQS